MIVGFGPKRCWSVLLAVAGLFASPTLWAQDTDVASVTPEAKLTAAIEVLQQFDAGAPEVEVIVNLADPLRKPRQTEWDSRPKLRGWQRTVRSRQDEVLAALPPEEFRARHLFENQSGFSGFVTRKGLEKLALHPRVASIQYSRPVQPHLAQGIARMNAAAQRSTYGGSNVAIAIVDSGIDYTHPLLGGTTSFPNSKVIGGTNMGDSIANPMPSGNAHGTACAGIAAGNIAANQGDYIGGVAPNAKLYALKITAGAATGATEADIVAAWNWCITHKNDDPNNPILVISTSFGGGRYNAACDSAHPAYAVAAANAASAGITLLVSSGNDGFCDGISAPACVSGVIAVGAVFDAGFGTMSYCIDSSSCAPKYNHPACSPNRATDDVTAADKVTHYSNTADFLGLLAPGHRAHTTDIVGAGGSSAGNYYLEFGGTSAAAPYAAGAVAALQSAARTLTGRYLTPAEVRTVLTSSGDPVTDTKATQITKPRVNLGRAIESLVPPRLTATRGNNRVVVSWPTNNNTGYVLEWAHALPATTWSNVAAIPVTVGTNRYVTNPISAGPMKFYRLRK
jgi:subtilisin family serine protease